MASKNTKQTSPQAATAASKVLHDGTANRDDKKAAGSALSQAPGKKAPAKKTTAKKS